MHTLKAGLGFLVGSLAKPQDSDVFHSSSRNWNWFPSNDCIETNPSGSTCMLGTGMWVGVSRKDPASGSGSITSAEPRERIQLSAFYLWS